MKKKFGYGHLRLTGSNFKDNVAQIWVYFQSLDTKLTYEEAKYNVIIFVDSFTYLIIENSDLIT